MDYLFIAVCFIIACPPSIGYALYYYKERESRQTYGIPKGHQYIYQMTVRMKDSRVLRFDLYGNIPYRYPELVLIHLHNGVQVDSYVIDFGSRILLIRMDMIASVEMVTCSSATYEESENFYRRIKTVLRRKKKGNK